MYLVELDVAPIPAAPKNLAKGKSQGTVRGKAQRFGVLVFWCNMQFEQERFRTAQTHVNWTQVMPTRCKARNRRTARVEVHTVKEQ